MKKKWIYTIATALLVCFLFVGCEKPIDEYHKPLDPDEQEKTEQEIEKKDEDEDDDEDEKNVIVTPIIPF